MGIKEVGIGIAIATFLFLVLAIKLKLREWRCRSIDKLDEVEMMRG